MLNLGFLVALSLAMGAAGLVAFLWSMRDGQYDDLDGAAERILLDDGNETASDRDHPGAPRDPIVDP